MTSTPALLRGASAALLVVLFHLSPARADTITGSIDFGAPGGFAYYSNGVYYGVGGAIAEFSGDYTELTGGLPASGVGGAMEFDPATDTTDAVTNFYGGSTADPDVFTFYSPPSPGLPSTLVDTFVLDPLSWVETTTDTATTQTLSATAIGIADATGFDPTWATFTVNAVVYPGLAVGLFEQNFSTMHIVLTANGVAIDQPFPMPDASSTAVLFAVVGVGLFAASRRRGALRHKAE